MPYRYLFEHDLVFRGIISFIGASFSWFVSAIGQAVPSDVGDWLQTGGLSALVICLVYGIIAVWKARAQDRVQFEQQRTEERASHNVEMAALLSRIDAKDKELASINEAFRQEFKEQLEQLTRVLVGLERHNNRDDAQG